MHMQVYEFGNKDAETLLIQPVDDHDLAVIESEVAAIRKMAGEDFCLKAVKVKRWMIIFLNAKKKVLLPKLLIRAA